MLQPTGINRNAPDSQGTKFDFHKKDQICHIWGCRISSILEQLHFSYFKFVQNNYTWINENVESGAYFLWLPWSEGSKNIIINVDIETRMFWFLNSPKQNILTINCKDCLYTTAQVIGDKNFKYNQDQRLWQSQYLPAAYVVSVQKHCQFLLTGIVQEVVSSLYKCVSSRGLLTCRFFLKSVRLMKIRYFSLFAL